MKTERKEKELESLYILRTILNNPCLTKKEAVELVDDLIKFWEKGESHE